MGLSPDGRWWWNGMQWHPAVSADGRRRFDGLRWRPNRNPLAVTLVLVTCVEVAVLYVCSFVFTMHAMSVPEYPGQPLPEWVLVLHDLLRWGWAPVAATLVGAMVAWLRRPVPAVRRGDRPPGVGV